MKKSKPRRISNDARRPEGIEEGIERAFISSVFYIFEEHPVLTGLIEADQQFATVII